MLGSSTQKRPARGRAVIKKEVLITSSRLARPHQKITEVVRSGDHQHHVGKRVGACACTSYARRHACPRSYQLPLFTSLAQFRGAT